jgi:hypothetical protein
MHVVITFCPVDPAGSLPPDPAALLRPPPRVLWHYTTQHKLERILEHGAILPATAGVGADEKPVVWFSSRASWEPSATKAPAPGSLGQILTAAAEGGLVRIAVLPEVAPFGFAHLPLIAGTAPSTCVRLCVAGIEMGADPDDWRFTADPVPRSRWHAVERYRFEDDVWVLAEVSPTHRPVAPAAACSSHPSDPTSPGDSP